MNEIDILRVLETIGVEKTNKVKDNVMVPCILAPWTHESGSDRNPSMGIKINNEEDSLYFCFTCKKKGVLTGLLMELNTYTQGKHEEIEQWAIARETNTFLNSLPDLMEAKSIRGPFPIPKKFDPSLLDKYKGSVPRYILDRGILIDTCKDWQLGNDKEKQRVVFPIVDWFQNLVGMVGRDVTGKQTERYYNYWNFNKAHYLYGEHMLSKKHRHIVIVEGMISTLAVYQAGIHNVVGSMGSYLSEEQVKKILTTGLQVYLMADPDKAGETFQKNFNNQMRGSADYRTVSLPGLDPADCTQTQLHQAFEEAKEL